MIPYQKIVSKTYHTIPDTSSYKFTVECFAVSNITWINERMLSGKEFLMSNVRRVYVEKKPAYAVTGKRTEA